MDLLTPAVSHVDDKELQISDTKASESNRIIGGFIKSLNAGTRGSSVKNNDRRSDDYSLRTTD